MFTSYDGQKKWGCCFSRCQAMIERADYFFSFFVGFISVFFLKLFFQSLFSEFFFRHTVRAAFFDFHLVGGVPAAFGGGGFVPAASGGGGFFRRRVIPPAAPGSGSRGGGPGLRPRLRVPGGRSGSRPRRRRGPGTRRGGGGRAWSRDFCVLIIGLKDSYDYTLIACFRVT
jgi:hypothetical protein